MRLKIHFHSLRSLICFDSLESVHKPSREISLVTTHLAFPKSQRHFSHVNY